MSILGLLGSLSERVYIMVFAGVCVLAAFSAYFIKQDTYVLEQKILSRQKDVAAVQASRDLYEARRLSSQRLATKPAGPAGISLALIEEIVTRSFVGGRLTSLKPVGGKEERERQQMVIELKIAGAPLAEVVSFTKALEAKGLRAKKLQMTLPQAGGALLDISATIAEGSVR